MVADPKQRSALLSAEMRYRLAERTVGLVSAGDFRERREAIEAEEAAKAGKREREEAERLEKKAAKKAKRERQEKAKLSFEEDDEG